MQVTLTHNSELRAHKLQALNTHRGMDYPVSGDNHYPSVGEEVEIIKHENQREKTEREYAASIARLFKKTQNPSLLTKWVDAMENQETLF